MGLTVSNVNVASSLLSDEVSGFCLPRYANSFVALISCLLLQYFAKLFRFPHRIHCLPKAGHFLGPPWCGHCFPQLKHDFFPVSSTAILSTSCLTVTSVGVWVSAFMAC